MPNRLFASQRVDAHFSYFVSLREKIDHALRMNKSFERRNIRDIAARAEARVNI